MSTIIAKEKIIIRPPESEAAVQVQRTLSKQRTVGSYYLSDKLKEVALFLNDFSGTFILDLGISYLRCRDAYETLISDCSVLYRKNLEPLKDAMTKLEYASHEKPDSLLSAIDPPKPCGVNNKYLKFSGNTTAIKIFKTLLLGDISEIVIQRLDINVFVVYVSPIKEATIFFNDCHKLLNYVENKE